jgi:hypothetical protein
MRGTLPRFLANVTPGTSLLRPFGRPAQARMLRETTPPPERQVHGSIYDAIP